MTTNHPAHGPVSLDRLHQISEILSKAAAQSDGGNLGHAMADAVKVIDGAITSFDAEPVAIVPVMYKGVELLKKDGLELIRDGMAEATELESMCMAKALLSAQPAPVVPEWTNEQCLEFLSIAFRHAEIKGDLELDDIRLGMKMVNESRAAMLQAGNSPVTPDGYVLVPKEITCAMDDAAWEAYHETRSMSDIWAALLAAAPQQEVKSALEHGMQRYSGAMQKLSEGDK